MDNNTEKSVAIAMLITFIFTFSLVVFIASDIYQNDVKDIEKCISEVGNENAITCVKEVIGYEDQK